MRAFKLLVFIGVLVWFASCKTAKTTVNNYLENLSDTAAVIGDTVSNPIIQKGDILSIRVYSMSINPATDIPYNLPEQVVAGSSATTTSGFLVDQNGNIEYPRLGTIQAQGLTKEELAETLRTKLEGQLTQPSVIVRFVNYKITVLGEVNSPGTFPVSTERITILEALGLAGDITEFGKKTNLKVLRENNGKREIGTIDLTSKEMFSSPFYRLQQNDVVFVDQTSRRAKQQDQQALAQQVGIGASIITAIALILNLIK